MHYRFITILISAFLSTLIEAYPITSYLEMIKTSNVGSTWKNLTLSNTYTNPVIACTYNLPSNLSNEAVVRVQYSGSNIQVKIQQPLNSSAVTASDVYCTISESGSYTYPIKYEAHTITSTNTNYAANWSVARMENVTASKVQTYSRAVVIGQVMSYNNVNFSAFWSNACGSRSTPPNNTNICIGKHTGETIPTAPTTETLGYFIAEQGEYILANSYVNIALGADSIRGVGDSPSYNYALPRTYSYATATQTAMDGHHGSWAVLYGASPVSNQLKLALDEETGTGDATRTHATEQVSYWVMQPINKTYADMIINEVMYRQSSSIKEFIEFSVLSNGSILNYMVSSQDGNTQNYRLPDTNVLAGDYVIFYSGSGANSSLGGIHHIYSNGNVAVLQNTADDIVLLKPSSTDATTLSGSGTHNVIPVDYMTYGTGGSVDAAPTSINGVSVNWNSSQSSRLGGSAVGESISLTPNASDSDTSICWERSATIITSKKATNCTGYIPTKDTDASSFINSLGKDNTSSPIISLSKTLITIYDPFNGASNPKAIPSSVLEYTIIANNNGNLAADNNTTKISDLIPNNTKLCVADTGYCKAPYFVNGTPNSGLTLAGISYSNNNGTNYTYTASGDVDGADSSVTNLRASMNGDFQAKIGATAPNFSLKFRVIVE